MEMTHYDEEPTGRGRGGSLRNILLAVGAGAVAVVVIGYASQPRGIPATSTTQPLVLEEPEPPVTTTSPVETTTSTINASVDLTLREHLPDSVATLVATLTGTGNTRQLLSWPSDGSKSSVGLPDGSGPVIFFDASDRQLAFLGPAIQRGGQTLYVGDPNAWEPVATDVTSFAWHATRPGRLTWVEAGGDLCVADPSTIGSIGGGPICHPGITGRLTGFDDLGVLVVDGGEIIRFTLGGEEMNRLPGTDTSIGPDGRILVENRDPGGLPVQFSLAQPDLSDVTFLQWAPTEAVSSPGPSAWSPQAFSPELAFLVPQADGRFQIQRWDLAGNALNALNVAGQFWDIGWDRSGRYLLAPGFFDTGAGVLVYDLFSTELTYLPFDDPVQEAALAIPATCEDASHLRQDWEDRTEGSIANMSMVQSREAQSESLYFVSGRITSSPHSGAIGTWVLPGYPGVGLSREWVPANDVAADLTTTPTSLDDALAELPFDDWMLLDGARISQWCVSLLPG